MATKQKPPVIELRDITKIFGKGDNKVTALDDVSLKIMDGEFVAIMGRSGSGKSTMMNIIGLLDRDFDGDYLLNHKKVSKLSENQTADVRSSGIGFVFQQFNLLKRTTALDNVMLPTMYNPRPEDSKRAIEMLKAVGLGDRIHNKTNQLSGGQVQRVAIARALMMNPDIILADEPTGNLDSKTAHQIMDVLKDINKKGKTIVLITHEEDIADYADRKIILLDGQLEGAQQ